MNISVQEPKKNLCLDFYSFCVVTTYLLFLLRKVRDTIFGSNENTGICLCDETLAVMLQVAVV